MVGVRELRIDDAACQYGDVVRNDEAVEGDLEVRLRVPWSVRVAAARYRFVRIKRCDQTEVLRNVVFRQGLGPGVFRAADAEDLGAVSQKVFVEVTAADHVIAGFIFFDHVVVEHLQLSVGDGGVCRVSGQVQVDEYQLLAVCSRETIDRITAIQIEHFGDIGLDRQAAAQGRSDRIVAERLQTGLGRAVRFQDRVKQVRGIIVYRERPVFGMLCVQTVNQHFTLVNLIGTSRSDVDFLDQRKISIKISQFLPDGCEILHDGRLAERA